MFISTDVGTRNFVCGDLGCLGQRQVVGFFVGGGWRLGSMKERDLLTSQITLSSVRYYRLLLRNNWSAVRRPLQSKETVICGAHVRLRTSISD